MTPAGKAYWAALRNAAGYRARAIHTSSRDTRGDMITAARVQLALARFARTFETKGPKQ